MPSRSFARIAGRCLALNLLVALALSAFVLISLAGQEGASVARPAAAGSAAALVEAHDCWTGAAPAGAFAHHVVVTVDGVTRYGGQRLTDRAIEQAVFGVEHGLTVHGFCA